MSLFLAILINGCDGCDDNGGGVSADVSGRTTPVPEASFGSVASGSTTMQSEHFKTRGVLGVFSGQVIEGSNIRSSGVQP
ncbi:MAG: hypothetical protein Q7S98_05435 [Deltaproteobacteria bacterium]|nr:hypothetical protein [Deltaproteobacteria bacterium]